MPLRLYTDECVDARIIAGIRHRKVDVITANEEGMRHATDAQQMERAFALGRIPVSNDQDFLRMVSASEQSPGLLFIRPKTSVGQAVRRITRIAYQVSPEEMATRVEWI
jgi:predicted nuclease of predicted toxin-antitoxin system